MFSFLVVWLTACAPTTTVVGLGDDDGSTPDTGEGADTGGGDTADTDTGEPPLPCAGTWEGTLELDVADPRGDYAVLCEGEATLTVADDGEVQGTGWCEGDAPADPGAPEPPPLELSLEGTVDAACTATLAASLAPEGEAPVADGTWGGELSGETGEITGEGEIEPPPDDPHAPDTMDYVATMELGR